VIVLLHLSNTLKSAFEPSMTSEGLRKLRRGVSGHPRTMLLTFEARKGEDSRVLRKATADEGVERAIER
jgi:hypothetical protein